MTPIETINWLLLAVLALAALAVAFSYLKSYDITRPLMRRTPVAYIPDQYALAHEVIDFATADGLQLKGWFIPAAGGETGKTLILCHGWGSNRGELMRDTHFLAAHGFNLFYFDFRGAGESGGGAVSSVGYLETRDFDAAYEFLRNNRPHACERVGLFGTSMGGSVAVFAAAKYPEIKCLLVENTFLSYRRVISNFGWLRMKLPYWPLVPLTLFFVRMRLGADPEPFSPVHNIAGVTIPALFINGDYDDLVPLADAKKLYSLCRSARKDLWELTGATHGKCADVGGEVYKDRVSKFFLENM